MKAKEIYDATPVLEQVFNFDTVDTELALSLIEWFRPIFIARDKIKDAKLQLIRKYAKKDENGKYAEQDGKYIIDQNVEYEAECDIMFNEDYDINPGIPFAICKEMKMSVAELTVLKPFIIK